MDYSLEFSTIVPAKLRNLGLQVVRIDSTTSDPLKPPEGLNTGAPQGWVLSTLLYSLYTHDCKATHSSNKFTDNTKVMDLITSDDETTYRDEVRSKV